MDIVKTNRILRTLSLSASDTRRDTLRSIIFNSLFEYNEPLSLSELSECILSIYGISPYESELRTTIESLQQSDLIDFADGKYTLSPTGVDKYNKLDIELKDEDKTRFQNFSNFLKFNLQEEVTASDQLKLWNVFKEFIYDSFFHYGEETLKYFHPQLESTGYEPSLILKEAYNKLEDSNLIQIFKKVVDHFADNATQDDIDYLNDLAQKTLAFTSLGLDEETYKSEIDVDLVDWIIYLDTNVLFSLLNLHIHPENEACRELIKLVSENSEFLQVKFRYTDLTHLELIGKKSDFEDLDENLSPSAIAGILKTDDLDEYSRKYYQNVLSNREETLHPSGVIDYSQKTLEAQGILIGRTKAMLKESDFEFIESQINEYQNYIQFKNDVRKEYSKKKKINLRPLLKSDSQARHDLTLMEVVEKLRKTVRKDESPTFNNVKYYGLSLDGILISYEQHLIRQSTDPSTYPIFFKPSFLLNKLVKLLPVKTNNYKKAFIKAITSRGFNKDIAKSRNIVKVASYLRNQGVDNEEVIFNLVSEELFLEKFKEHASDGHTLDEFVESEINKLFKKRNEELKDAVRQIEQLESGKNRDSAEKRRLVQQKSEKEFLVNQLSESVKKLSQKIQVLEESQHDFSQTVIDFDSAEKDKVIDKLQSKIAQHEEHEKERALRKKVSWWRVWGVISLAIVFAVSLLISWVIEALIDIESTKLMWLLIHIPFALNYFPLKDLYSKFLDQEHINEFREGSASAKKKPNWKNIWIIFLGIAAILGFITDFASWLEKINDNLPSQESMKETGQTRTAEEFVPIDCRLEYKIESLSDLFETRYDSKTFPPGSQGDNEPRMLEVKIPNGFEYHSCNLNITPYRVPGFGNDTCYLSGDKVLGVYTLFFNTDTLVKIVLEGNFRKEEKIVENIAQNLPGNLERVEGRGIYRFHCPDNVLDFRLELTRENNGTPIILSNSNAKYGEGEIEARIRKDLDSLEIIVR